MKSIPLLFSLLIIIPSGQQAALSSPSKSTNFIRSRCSTTRYPDLCYASLVRYAKQVQHDNTKLAIVATNVTLAQLHKLLAHVTAIQRNASHDERPALDDCVDTLGDAVDQAKYSVKELVKIEDSKVKKDVRWHVSNAQTWMSAAMTNEDTCIDGFDGVKNDVCLRVEKVMEYTSNALALTNCVMSG